MYKCAPINIGYCTSRLVFPLFGRSDPTYQHASAEVSVPHVPPTDLAPLSLVTMAAHSRGVLTAEAVEADVELTTVGALAGEEDDDAPLLRNYHMATPAVGAAVSPGVHPLPNSSYTRDSHSWASKLVFSWVDPVLEKVNVFRNVLKL